MSNSNTVPKQLKPFVKGDPRINRKGRPKSFDALRELAQQIAHEPVMIGDKKITVTEAILRQWAQSKNPQLQKGFLEIAYGKVPDDVNVKVDQRIEVEGVDYRTAIANLAPGSMADSESSGESKDPINGSKVG